MIQPAVAILYQALPPPVIGGARKDPKPGGYSDSGADIGFCLAGAGVRVVTPVPTPDPTTALDWVFPDTAAGIRQALEQGASHLWANTVLFAGHPLEEVMASCWVVGQRPADMQAGDDKFTTNTLLRAHGLPLPASILGALAPRPGVQALATLTPDTLRAHGLGFPMIVKPVRGRGSQGVTLVEDHKAFMTTAAALINSSRFGDDFMVEQFLPGAEMTVTVLPRYGAAQQPLALPPVLRFDQHDGVAPYNGVVAVIHNSRALTPDEHSDPAVADMLDHCITATGLVNARAPVRIDCRADEAGVLRLFDLNMKPNLTGAGRPGRDEQESLSAIAARARGWRYRDLLLAMLAGAWRDKSDGLLE